MSCRYYAGTNCLSTSSLQFPPLACLSLSLSITDYPSILLPSLSSSLYNSSFSFPFFSTLPFYPFLRLSPSSTSIFAYLSLLFPLLYFPLPLSLFPPFYLSHTLIFFPIQKIPPPISGISFEVFFPRSSANFFWNISLIISSFYLTHKSHWERVSDATICLTLTHTYPHLFGNL